MITENLSTLKIHKLTQEQYERERDAGRIDSNALYLTPDEGQVQSDWNQTNEIASDFIKNKPDVVLRSEIEEIDAIEIVVKAGLVSPIAAENGSIYTDENGAIYTL